uniref:hypothetical protein n=1 Tax=Brucella pseudintermedia TaxID=370111 RepID=UPI001589CD7A|nr:hypothetical protein [Brucella pseudintermedia]
MASERTPQQIIGDDAYAQLVFEGYVVTRPAPAAPVDGLERYRPEPMSLGGMVRDPDGGYVTRSQAEKLLAAERAEHDNTLATLFNNILREAELTDECTALKAENAALIHDLNRIKDHETELVNDNAEKDARIKELGDERYKLACAITGGEDAPGYLGSLSVETLVEVARDNTRRWFAETDRAEALEAKLAAAEKALEPFADHAKERAVDAQEWRDTDTVKIVVTIADLRAARAVLGGKPL